MKEITVTCTWQSTHVLEVPDEFEVPDALDGFSTEMLEELTSDTAALVDWE